MPKNWKIKRRMPDSVLILYCLWMTGEKGKKSSEGVFPVTVNDEGTGETLEKGSNGHIYCDLTFVRCYVKVSGPRKKV